MHWILEKLTDNINKSGQDKALIALVDILASRNISHSFHQIIPFIGEACPPINENIKNAICIGPYSMRFLCKKNKLFPGVFDIEEFNFAIQKEKWGEEMLNYDSVITSFNTLEKLSNEKLFFARPIDDSKCFAGNIFTGKDLNEWKKNILNLDSYGDNNGDLNGNTLIQISSVKDILEEYRFWIVEGNIITYSLYKKGNKVITSADVNSDVIDYVKKIISIWEPHKAFVLDVARLKEGFKVIEINTLNAAGFYKANLESIVDALEKSFTV